MNFSFFKADKDVRSEGLALFLEGELLSAIAMRTLPSIGLGRPHNRRVRWVCAPVVKVGLVDDNLNPPNAVFSRLAIWSLADGKFIYLKLRRMNLIFTRNRAK